MRRDSYAKLEKKLRSPLLEQVTLDDEDSFSKINTQDLSPAKTATNQPSQTSKDAEKTHMGRLCRKLRKMSNHELETLLASEDDLFIDCLIDSNPTIRKLSKVRDELQQEVSDLAKFNYAREPEFSRDRMKLRELLNGIAPLKNRVTSGHANRILEKFSKAETELSTETEKCEQASEVIANDFLEGRILHDAFTEDYIKSRTDAHKKRILADKLIKFKSQLADNLTTAIRPSTKNDPPTPTPRQRKRVSFHG